MEGEVSGLPVNPSGLAPPSGFSHGVISGVGRLLPIAGETGHHPAMALIGVSELVDPRALVEITGVAVIEDDPADL
jgi:enamine deaminase RidA (YjgF/YER057c/UK114 family)